MFYSSDKTRGILFDLDNTLLPSRICHQQAMSSVETLLRMNYEVQPEVSTSIINLYKELLGAERIDPENVKDFKKWRIHLWNKSLAKHEVDTVGEMLYEHAEVNFLKEMVFSKEVVSILLELREHFKIAIITNGESYFQNLKLERCKAMKFVDEVFVSENYNLEKPDSKFFHYACRKLGVEVENCIMVGDNMYTDILGGQQASFKATVLLTQYNIPCDMISQKYRYVKPDFFIPRLYDLISVLKKVDWEVDE